MTHIQSIEHYIKIFALSCVIMMALITHANADDITSSTSVGALAFPASSSVIDMPNLSSNAARGLPMAYPTLNMTQDKSEMIKLTQEAASVVVGNPNHISVMLDTPDTLIVVPRKAGASHFSVIGKDGNILMQRHVIVGAPKENYVRIRRSCNAKSGAGCQKTSTYYCPGTCHEVQENLQ